MGGIWGKDTLPASWNSMLSTESLTEKFKNLDFDFYKWDTLNPPANYETVNIA